jgi:hypothetical protein
MSFITWLPKPIGEIAVERNRPECYCYWWKGWLWRLFSWNAILSQRYFVTIGLIEGEKFSLLFSQLSWCTAAIDSFLALSCSIQMLPGRFNWWKIVEFNHAIWPLHAFKHVDTLILLLFYSKSGWYFIMLDGGYCAIFRLKR